MPITYKQTGLDLGHKLAKLQTEGKLIARSAIASKLRDLIEEGFVLEREPRGRAWEPRRRSYPWRILDRTGAMRRGFKIDARAGRSITVTNDAEERGRNYPIFHQFGWKTASGRAPARQVMPVKSMPDRWKRELDAVVAAALERLQ